MLAALVANASAQFAPSRPQLNIPGAIPLGPVPQRGERVASGPAQGLIRVRRPLQKPAGQPQQQTSQARFFEEHEAKPVNEELEDEPFTPHIQQSSPPSPPQPPKSLFTSEPQDNLNDIGFNQQSRFANQPIAAPQQQTPSNAQRFNIERPKAAAPQLRQLQRPISRPAQSFDDYDERPSRPANRVNNEQRPQQKPRDRESKPKRPVATIISKYRDVSAKIYLYIENFINFLYLDR